MPHLSESSYLRRPFYMLNPHWETIVPSMFFKGPDVAYKRERQELTDGDFLDIDYLRSGNSKCVVITHGLEGDSNRYYVRRTASYFHERGWDIVAWNCRSCSGEMNRLPGFYHHGETDDLGFVIEKIASDYDEIVLFGYSMGGSMSLKYLGERTVDDRIKGAITFSVPCNLRDSADALKIKGNSIYERRFLKKLVAKMKLKATRYPDLIDVSDIDAMTDFDEFHQRYTAPLHGFQDSKVFFEEATCDRYLSGIKVPVFIGNALNDPMLAKKCYPYELANSNKHIYLETPKYGGHVGFTLFRKYYSWMEVRAEQFLSEVIFS